MLGPGLSDVHARDVEMLTAMGANAVRVYGVQKNYNYHGELWDMLHAANITVMAGFDIYGQFLADRGVMERVKYELRETLRANHHPAIGMWAIGNELNGAWNGWVGDPGDCAGPCLFGGDVALLYSSIDELCQVVVEWGKLCTTVLADVPVPRSVTLRTWTDDPCDRLLPETAGLTAAEAARAELTELGVAPDAACDAVTHCALLDCLWAGYLSERSCPRFGNDYYGDATDDGTFRFGCCCGAPVAHDGVTRWVEVVEQAANLTGIGAWAANVYRGFTFGPLFQTYAASSGKPFVVGEYGIDAYDMTTRRENGDLQSEWVRRLMRELEANAASCVGGCASEVAAGGFVMSWSDEWHKGHDIVQACATDGTDATNPRCADDAIVDCRSDWSRARCVRFWQQGYEPLGCPDYDATAHSRCGLYNRRSQPDDWLNEEWWGIAALVPCAPPPEGYRRAALRPRRLYYELQRAWAGGVGCVVHDANGTALPPPPFDPISYPDCAAAVAAAHTDLATLLTGDLYGRLPFTDEVIDETIPSGSQSARFAARLRLAAALVDPSSSLSTAQRLTIPLTEASNVSAAEAEALAQLRAGSLRNATCTAAIAEQYEHEPETDGCLAQTFVHCLLVDGDGAPVCPPRAPVNVTALIEAAAAAHVAHDSCPAVLEPPPPPSPPVNQWPEGRLTARDRTLYLDGAAWIMRGICYSPVPWGDDPGYAEPYGDYFTTEWEAIFTRDIALFVAMGTRWDASPTQGASHTRSPTPLTPRSSSSLYCRRQHHPAVHVQAVAAPQSLPRRGRGGEPRRRRCLRDGQRRADAAVHGGAAERGGGAAAAECDRGAPPGARDVASGERAQRYEGTRLGHSRGRLAAAAQPHSSHLPILPLQAAGSCSSATTTSLTPTSTRPRWCRPTADACSETTPPPSSLPSTTCARSCTRRAARSARPRSLASLCPRSGCGRRAPSTGRWDGWCSSTRRCAIERRVSDDQRAAHGPRLLLTPLLPHPLLQVRHLDLWAYNAYPGKNFTAFNWDAYAAYVKKPLLISEYGIDAYDSDADPKLNLGFERDDIDVGGGDGSGVFVMGSPRDEIQAEWLLSLIEDLERHSTTCEGELSDASRRPGSQCSAGLLSHLTARSSRYRRRVQGEGGVWRLSDGLGGRALEGARDRCGPPRRAEHADGFGVPRQRPVLPLAVRVRLGRPAPELPASHRPSSLNLSPPQTPRPPSPTPS